MNSRKFKTLACSSRLGEVSRQKRLRVIEGARRILEIQQIKGVLEYGFDSNCRTLAAGGARPAASDQDR
jgi:hypothetical protein